MRERKIFWAALGALVLVLAACQAPLDDPRAAAPDASGPAWSVPVEIAGAELGGASGTETRSLLMADGSITSVTVTAFSGDTQVGSGTLTKGPTSWTGSVNVSATGTFDFVGLARNASNQVVYSNTVPWTVSAETPPLSFSLARASLLPNGVTPASGSSSVAVRDGSGNETLEFRFQFSASLNPGVNPTLSFSNPPRILKVGANAGKIGHPYETEATVSYTQTVYPNDTVIVKPLYGYAHQTYANAVLSGLQAPGGAALGDVSLPSYSISTAPLTLSTQVTDWRSRVMYFALTDRFNDGNPANNQFITSGDSDHILGDGKTYQGGDYAGLRAKLDYLQELGITALWITAPVRQAWENATYTSYHGYWAQDFYAVDPHLGTLKDLRDLVKDAHARGIAVILDVVVNHVGSLGFYDLNGNNAPDNGEWEPAFASGGYGNFKWLEDISGGMPSWAFNANRLKPYFGPLPTGTTLLDFMTRKGGNATTGAGDAVTDGDFAGLRDVNTSHASVRDRLTEIFQWWIANTNIDGYRIDTVKHVNLSFWEHFNSNLRSWAAARGKNNFYTLAEVYDGSPAGLGTYTGTNRLDSVLGFHLANEVFDWNDGDNVTIFKDSGTWSARPKTKALETAHSELTGTASLTTAWTNDGFSPRQKLGYFLDNHDLNRFLNGTSGVANEAPSAGELNNLRTALAWMMTWEGLPVLYYGTEQNYKQSLALSNSGEHGNGAGNVNKGNRPNLWQVANSTQGSTAWNQYHDTFNWIKGLAQLRSTYPALGTGAVSIRWTDDGTQGAWIPEDQRYLGDADDGILAYLRKGSTVNDDILVVLNTHPSQQSSASYASGNDMGTDWPVGTVLQVVPIPGFEASTGTVYNGSAWVSEVTTFTQAGKTSAVWFQVPANSVRILRKKP